MRDSRSSFINHQPQEGMRVVTVHPICIPYHSRQVGIYELLVWKSSLYYHIADFQEPKLGLSSPLTSFHIKPTQNKTWLPMPSNQGV